MTDKPQPLRSAWLEGPAGHNGRRIAHGFFTREGGVSAGTYAGLNVGGGSNDTPECVAENRRRVAETLGVSADHLMTVHQVHSADVLHVTQPFGIPRPKADAMVTDVPGIAIGALSADCGPVLFADHKAGVVGSAHAGWRGAFDGVLENTVEAMIGLGASRENIIAVLGPTIGPENYEVGPEFYGQFITRDPAYTTYFRPSNKEGHRLFDLWRFITDRLTGAGVQADALRQCTYANEDLFYSYRRMTHRNEPDYGRQIAAIAIIEN
ncbi:peptidoglycan editing factor PgeF [Falsochrobactrum shanghaiense]|uniref:Purine nucleoside phosphorylase n=1 Tax=Falsochrobactrum shanghaiense TaxID=2201899 RepID=A0A316J572_9HYPH|nr:peptidoglycan editing factor PgeF [Falsochrobactrum shanghaiense]PWL17082.1 peptidoglycan editing factor PgeF [Falsochrobactrum shanghaiense]